MKPLLLLIQPYKPSTQARVDVRVSDGLDREAQGMGGVRWWAAMSERPSISIELMSLDLDGRVQAGRMSLSINLNHIGAAEVWTALKWKGAPIACWSVEEMAYGRRFVEFSGLITSQKLDLDTGELKITAEVPVVDLDVDMLTLEFSGGGGALGDPEVRGTLKPAGFGICENIEPVWFDKTRWIGMLDGYGNTLSIDKLMEGASSFGAAQANYATYAALAAAIDAKAVAPGRWATCLAEGLVGLGAPPAGVIGVNATFGLGTVAGMFSRILTTHAQIPAGEVDAASIATVGAAVPYPAHLWVSQQRTVKTVIEALAASINATPIRTPQGKFTLTRAVASAAVATLNRSGAVRPRVTDWQTAEPVEPYWKIKARAARPANVLTFDQVNYADDIIDRGLYSAATIYRAGNVVWLADKSSWLYINALPAAGNAQPIWPVAANAYWQNLNPPASASDLRYSNGATIDSLRPAAFGADPTASNTAAGIAGQGPGATATGPNVLNAYNQSFVDFEVIGAETFVQLGTSFYRSTGGFGGTNKGAVLTKQSGRSGFLTFEYDFTNPGSAQSYVGFTKNNTLDLAVAPQAGGMFIAAYINSSANEVRPLLNGVLVGAAIAGLNGLRGTIGIAYSGTRVTFYHNGVPYSTALVADADQNQTVKAAYQSNYVSSGWDRSAVYNLRPMFAAAASSWAEAAGVGRPSDYATAGLGFKGTANATVVGSNYRQTLNTSSGNIYTVYAYALALKGGCYASFRWLGTGGVHLGLFKTSAPTVMSAQIRLLADGTLARQMPGQGFVSTIQTGIVAGDTIGLGYDGVNYYVTVNGAPVYSVAALEAGLEYIPKWAILGSAITDASGNWHLSNLEFLPVSDNSFASMGGLGLGRTSYVTGEGTAAAITGQAPAATDATIQSGATNDKFVDRRSTNELPSWYRTNYPLREVREFKDGQALGITATANSFGTLVTTIDYGDVTGGRIKQRFTFGAGVNPGKSFIRLSAAGSDATWGSWSRVYDAFTLPNFTLGDLEESTGVLATVVNYKTSSGIASGIAGQGGFATRSTITGDADLGGLLANRLMAAPADANYLRAGRVIYDSTHTLEALKPSEGGANITEVRVAASIAGQGPGATAVGDDVLNFRVNGSITNIAYPGGGYYTASAAGLTGRLRIALPVTVAATMLRFQVDVYNYEAGTSASYLIAGYLYNDAGQQNWINCSAQLIGSDARSLPVRFGYNGGVPMVTIGEDATTWNYPQIVIRNVTLGYNSNANAAWRTGWVLSLATSGMSITAQTILRPRAGDAVFGEGVLEAAGGALATLANFKTSSGVASGIAGQGQFATWSSLPYGTSYISGLPASLQPGNMLGSYLHAGWVYYGDGVTPVNNLKPGEAGANVTEGRVAASIAGQTAWATLTANVNRVSKIADGGRVLDPTMYNTQLLLGPKSTTSLTPSYTVGGSNVTVNLPAHTRKVAGPSGPVTLSYGAVSGVVAFSTYWTAYIDDPDLAGIASPTVTFTSNPDDLLYPGRYQIASGVTPASGGTGGSSGGGGGLGGGYDGCVASYAWVEVENPAAQPDRLYVEVAGRFWVPAEFIIAGERIRVLTADCEHVEWREVDSNRLEPQPGVRITSASGVQLDLSQSTPMTLRDGSTVLAPVAGSFEIPVDDEARPRWEGCRVERIGEIIVAHISCSQGTYLAGNTPGAGIYSHNPLKP